MKLIKYYPPVLNDIVEIKEITRAVDIELEFMRLDQRKISREMFILSAEDIGLELWEKMLKIKVTDRNDIRLRRFNIIAKLMQKRPNIIDALNALIGEKSYNINYDYTNWTLYVVLKLDSKSYVNALKELLEAIVPLNIIIDVSIAYNTHNTLANFTHEQLGAYTHKQLIEEVLS